MLLTTSCADAGGIWGYELEDFRSRLRNRNYDFLNGIDFSSVRMEDALRLGPGGPWYMAELLQDRGFEEPAIDLLEVQTQQRTEPFRRLSYEELVSRLIAVRRYGDARDHAARARELYQDELSIALLHLEAHYWDEDDARLLELIDELIQSDIFRERLRDPFAPQSGELALWATVAAWRSGSEEWRGSLSHFVDNIPAAGYHVRLYLFTAAQEDMSDAMTPLQRVMLSARHHLASRDYDEAAAAFAEAVDLRLAAGRPLSRALITDAGEAFRNSPQPAIYVPQSEALLTWARNESDAGLVYHARYAHGRLLQAAGSLEAAYAFLDQAQLDADDTTDADTALWYAMQAAGDIGLDRVVRELPGLSRRMHSPGFFAGLLEELASDLLIDRRFEELWQAYLALEDRGPERIVARYAFILARLMDAGLMPAGRSGAGEDLVSELYARAYNQSSNPYYHIVTAGLTGRPVRLFGSRTEPDPPSDLLDEDFVAAYLDYGLWDKSYAQAAFRQANIATSALSELAERFSREGRYLQAMRLMRIAETRPDFALTDERARIMYPQAFPTEIADVIAERELDAAVFYALIREESGFTPDIVSHAGAIGLSQLMPATAADQARRLRIQDPDLRDPATNVEIGSYYYASLVRRFPSEMHALAAYNGGQGRVSRWIRNRPDFDHILYHESIPLFETRHHVRKVLVSAVYYGWLYENRNPVDVIRAIFPELETADTLRVD